LNYPNGQLARQGELVGGRREGPWVHYHDNGQTEAVGAYHDDHPEGPWTYWYASGTKQAEGRYHKGRQHGRWRFWYANGNEKADGWYTNGLRTGAWCFWNEAGKRVKRGDFEADRATLHWSWWQPDDRLREDGYFLRDAHGGPWTRWDGATAHRRWVPLPDGWELVRELGEDGKPRREGFLHDGRPAGRWVSRHANGTRRLTGDFADGRCTGRWIAWRPDGSVLATGFVTEGRPTGIWLVYDDGVAREVDTELEVRAPTTRAGEWSKGDEWKTASALSVVDRWLSEIETPVSRSAIVEPGAAAPTEAATLPLPAPEDIGEPVRRQPSFTEREIEAWKRWVEYYASGVMKSVSKWADMDYDGAPPGSKRPGRGKPSKSSAWLGKPVPVTRFKTGDGHAFDLAALRGKRVLVCVMYGFGGLVCPYCPQQLRALVRESAKFAKRDTRIVVVYPGSKQKLDAFMACYREQYADGEPPFDVVYDPGLALSKSLGVVVEGNLSEPTTLVLDRRGTVGYAYVGANKADRPPLAEVLEAVEDLGSQ